MATNTHPTSGRGNNCRKFLEISDEIMINVIIVYNYYSNRILRILSIDILYNGLSKLE